MMTAPMAGPDLLIVIVIIITLAVPLMVVKHIITLLKRTDRDSEKIAGHPGEKTKK